MLRYGCKAFAELTLDELYDALALRQAVFVLEQGPYLALSPCPFPTWCGKLPRC